MIRPYLKLPVFLLLFILIAGCSTVSTPRGDREAATPWSSLYYNTARVGRTPDNLTPPFEKIWSKKIRPFELFKLYPREQLSVPVTIGGLLYVGSTNKTFYSFDFLTGSRQWKYDADSPIESTPTIGPNSICFGTASGSLHCLDRATGEPLWTFKTGSEIISSPLITKHSVYVYSSSDRIFSLNPVSGKEVWSYRRSDYNMVTPRVRTSPALSPDGEKIFQVFSDGTLVCFEAFTGKILWDKKIYKPNISTVDFRRTPAVLGDTIYVPGDGMKVQALLIDSGRVLKNYKVIKARHFIVIDRNRLLTASSTEVALVDTKSAGIIWKEKINPISGTGEISAISVAGDTVLVLINTEKTRLNLDFLTSRKGDIMAMSMKDGHSIWNKKFSSTLSGGVSSSDGRFALLSNKGRLQVWGR